MEVSMTKMSENGQIGIVPSTKFLVFNKGGDIILKQIKKESLNKITELAMKVERSEDQIKKGKYTKADTSMSDEDIDGLLIG